MILNASLCAVAACVPALAFAQTPASRERAARVERGLRTTVRITGQVDASWTIEERMLRYKVPGVSIAMIDGGRVAWARGYGVVEAGSSRVVDTTTLFLAGSISKPVAATAALRMVERQQLALDENVNQRLTSWKVPENEFTTVEKATLRRLLSHSAGMTVHGFPGYASDKPVPTVVQVLNGEAPANTAPVRVNVVPGTLWRYSGGGTTVAQLLMSDVSGASFPRLMDSLVLRPLGMRSSTYENPLPASRAGRAATGHERADQPVRGKWHTYPEMFAAGLWTTPGDLALWVVDVTRAHRGEAAEVLSTAMARQMLTIQKGQWGLGVQLTGAGDSLGFTHGGRDQGFVATFTAFPARNQGVVIMSNGTSGQLLDEIMQSVAREYGWRERPRRERPAAVLADTAAFRDLVGRYRLALGSDTPIATVSRDGMSLVVTIPDLGVLPSRMLPDTSALRFFSPDMDLDVRFRRRSGPAESMSLIGGGRTIEASRVP